jgi:hypothetical protein
MASHLRYREFDSPKPANPWPKRRVILWTLLFLALGGLAFVRWVLST